MTPTITESRSHGHSMVGDLRRVLVCSPRAAGWNQPERGVRWSDLGFLHAPSFQTAQAQHEALCHELDAAGVELVDLPPSLELSLDAVYTHDPSFATDYGIILMNPGKPNRVAEARQHGESVSAIWACPLLGEIQPAGDHGSRRHCMARFKGSPHWQRVSN